MGGKKLDENWRFSQGHRASVSDYHLNLTQLFYLSVGEVSGGVNGFSL